MKITFLLAVIAGPALASQNRQVVIPIIGTIPAQCISQPQRVLVNNGTVTVTQYLRCNHPGRFVIQLGEVTKPQWTGTTARYKQAQKSLESGTVAFEINAGSGALETFTVVPKNPAAARVLAENLSTSLYVQQ